MSPLFLKKTVPNLYDHLLELAKGLSRHSDNIKAFYQLLFLLTLEFSQPGILDMVLYLKQLQALALGNDPVLSTQISTALHAIIAGVLHLISIISPSSSLQEHIVQVLETRRTSAPHLLPHRLFVETDGADGIEPMPDSGPLSLDKAMVFILDEEELLKKSPEQKKGFGEICQL